MTTTPPVPDAPAEPPREQRRECGRRPAVMTDLGSERARRSRLRAA